MIVDYTKQMFETLNSINSKINKIAKKNKVKIAHTEVYNQNERTASLMIETNCQEYVSDLMQSLLSKTKFEVESINLGEGQYDWDSDVYLKPYAVVTIKAY